MSKVKVGDKFGKLTVLQIKDTLMICHCDCGNIKELSFRKWGKIKSCGCLALEIARERFINNNPGKRQKPENLRGYFFGRLRVIEYFGRAPSGHPLWKCKCSCGNLHVVRADSLLQGRTRSCGCLREEKQKRRSLH